MPPIHSAAKAGDAARVRQALDSGVNVNAKDQGGNTPLIWAAYSGSLEVIKLLLDRGADTQVTYKKGWTPLHIASREGRIEVAKLLLEGGADLKAKNENGKTPLDLAVNDAMRRALREHAMVLGSKSSSNSDARRREEEEARRRVAKIEEEPAPPKKEPAPAAAPPAAAEEPAPKKSALVSSSADDEPEDESKRANEALDRMRKAAEEKRKKLAREEEERRRKAAEAEEERSHAAADEERRKKLLSERAEKDEDEDEALRRRLAKADEESRRRRAAEEEDAKRKQKAADEERKREEQRRAEEEERKREERRRERDEEERRAAADEERRREERRREREEEERRAAAEEERRRARSAATAAEDSYSASHKTSALSSVAASVSSTAASAGSAAARPPISEEEAKKAADDLDLVLRSCRLDEAAEAVQRILSVDSGRDRVLALKGEWEAALVEALGPQRMKADIRVMQLAALRALVSSFTPALGTVKADAVRSGLRKLSSLLAVAEEEEARRQMEDVERRRTAAEEDARRLKVLQDSEQRRREQEDEERRRKELEEEERRLRAAEEQERNQALVAAADNNDSRASMLEALGPAVEGVRQHLKLYVDARALAADLALLRTFPSVKIHGEEIAWFAEGVQSTQATVEQGAKSLALLRENVRRAVESGAPDYEIALAAAERDKAEEHLKAVLAEAARLCKELSSRQRQRGALIREVVHTISSTIPAAALQPVYTGDAFADLSGATVSAAQATKDLAARLLPAEARTQAVAQQLLECLAEEAAILEALESPVADAISAATKAAVDIGCGLLSETPDEDAEASAAMAVQREGELDRLRALEEERQLAAASREALTAAKRARDEAWVELEDLKHERKKAIQLGRPYTSRAEEDYLDAVAAIRARVAAIEADIARQEAYLRSAAVRECYPELGREALRAATALGPAAPERSFTSSAQFEEVKTLRLTPHTIVTRVKETARPEAPEHVIKQFPESDAAFLRDLQLLSTLRHPLVVPQEGAFLEGDRAYQVTPFYAAGSLRSWVDGLKERRGNLRPAEWAVVRRVFRQILQGAAYVHSRGVAHRDIKPENVFWQDTTKGSVVLTDFGITRNLKLRAENNRANAVSSIGYSAPETASLAFSDALWSGACDAWSVGLMILEIANGDAPVWDAQRRQLEGQPGKPLQLPKAGDKALQDFISLGLELCAESAPERPTVDEALMHAFFTAAAEPTAPHASAPPPVLAPTKMQAVAMLVGEQQQSSRKRLHNAEPYVLRIGLETLVEDVLRGHLQAPEAVLAQPWHAVLGGARAPFSEVLSRFFEAITAPESRLLERSAAAGAPLFLPADSVVKGARAFESLALGRVLGKCFLEGISINVEFAPIVYSSLLGLDGEELADPEAALAHLAAWDKGDAARLEAILLRRLGTGNDAILTVGSFLGTSDAQPLSDFNKREVICKYVYKKLVERRRDSLDSMARGFSAVVNAVGLGAPLQLFSGTELGAALLGSEHVDVDELKRLLVWDASWPRSEPQQMWLTDFLQRLSEPALRILIAKCTGRLRLRSDGNDSPILVLRVPKGGEAESHPRLPGGHILQLPSECATYELFESRLRNALGLGGDFTSALRLGLGDQRRLVRLLVPLPQVGKVLECTRAHSFGCATGTNEEEARCPECGSEAVTSEPSTNGLTPISTSRPASALAGASPRYGVLSSRAQSPALIASSPKAGKAVPRSP